MAPGRGERSDAAPLSRPMEATRGGTMTRSARILLLAAAGLIAAALLLPARAAAAKYAVAQCGWHVGNDADWSDTTVCAKFRPDSYCVTPSGADPFDGTHMKSFTKEGAGTVSGTRFARWRWTAPPGTGIVNVRATWWHALHDGLEHRIGTGTGNGGFDVFASADATDTELREFAVGFANPRPALESRLLCRPGADDHTPGRCGSGHRHLR